VPGADDVLALNVHTSVVPPVPISHVSDSFGPLTPNRATALGGFAIVTVADFVVPAYAAVIVHDVAPVPAFVENEKLAFVAPAATTTVDGTTTAESADRAIVAPPVGAADVSVTVPVLALPSVTVVSATDRLASAAAGDGVGVGVLGVVGVEEPEH